MSRATCTIHRGPADICAKLQVLPQGTQLAPSSIDVQPSLDPSAILVMCSGQMLIGGEQNPLNYCHLFQLKAIGPGQFYIHNEIFRLVFQG